MSMENKIPKPIRCKAAVCRGPGEALRIEEVVVAPPEDHEVRIKILCTSLCHSDLTFWRMKDFPGIFPRIFGHEAVGVVESVGGHVERLEAGDMVVPTFLGQCDATEDACVDCRSERSNMCSKLPFTVTPGMPRSHGGAASRFTDAAGRPVHHFLNVSSFSEYTVVDAAHVVRVDPTVPPEKACLLSCGASTGVGAAGKVAGVEAGSTVAIFGLGAVGLAVAEGARIRGASRIIGVDLNPDKFELGKKFGLTDFINPKELGDRSINEVTIHKHLVPCS
ncbi:alcohol dehydrogenase-like 7 isoform X2 [Ananas comosus]|uniref:Alcohol dehydrogenase-like 7 isoform X2 n=1 Tax=Ananas comosus TaxID=4615 RepID=A0A6P5G6X2_ANACO|nr:alcohol dehydrogenase-like 7 isoform X2 [Ananas comosus]